MLDDTSTDYRLIQGYITENGDLDYQSLWDDLIRMTGFSSKQNREARFKEVTEAYARWSTENNKDIDEAREDNGPVAGVTPINDVSRGYPPVPPISPVDWITYRKGTKGKNDYIIEAWGRQVTFEEVAQLFIELYKNENRIYPPPRFKGGNMLIEFLLEALIEGAVTWKLLKKYKLIPNF